MPGATTDIATPLSSMNLFLLTSEFEGTPNVVLEAQWLGLPVVATNAGGTSEALDEGVTGWCFKEPDACAMAAKSCALLTDSKYLNNLKTRGPEFIEEHFGLDRMIDETLCLYGVNNIDKNQSNEREVYTNERRRLV